MNTITPDFKVFILCPHCNKENEVKFGWYNHEAISAFQNCIHCKKRIDTWIRIPYNCIKISN